MNEPYDSRPDTEAHIALVKESLDECIGNLESRGDMHDESKLRSPEKEAFDILTPRLKGLKYGSEEYRASLRELKPALDHHYANNPHHPEHYEKWVCNICFHEMVYPAPERCPGCFNGQFTKEGFDICGMSLLDLLEMLCDWRAAQQRHDPPGTFKHSFDVNIPRYEIPVGLARVLRNTVRELGWDEDL